MLIGGNAPARSSERRSGRSPQVNGGCYRLAKCDAVGRTNDDKYASVRLTSWSRHGAEVTAVECAYPRNDVQCPSSVRCSQCAYEHKAQNKRRYSERVTARHKRRSYDAVSGKVTRRQVNENAGCAWW